MSTYLLIVKRCAQQVLNLVCWMLLAGGCFAVSSQTWAAGSPWISWGGTSMHLNAAGHIECDSVNGRDCNWSSDRTQDLNNNRVAASKPMACGAEHRQQWGNTGYDASGHWCANVFGQQFANWQAASGLSDGRGGFLPFNMLFAVNPAGDISCLSFDGANCQWQKSTILPHEKPLIQPLSCGAMHQTVWHDNGYDNPLHWCARIRSALRAAQNPVKPAPPRVIPELRDPDVMRLRLYFNNLNMSKVINAAELARKVYADNGLHMSISYASNNDQHMKVEKDGQHIVTRGILQAATFEIFANYFDFTPWSDKRVLDDCNNQSDARTPVCHIMVGGNTSEDIVVGMSYISSTVKDAQDQVIARVMGKVGVERFNPTRSQCGVCMGTILAHELGHNFGLHHLGQEAQAPSMDARYTKDIIKNSQPYRYDVNSDPLFASYVKGTYRATYTPLELFGWWSQWGDTLPSLALYYDFEYGFKTIMSGQYNENITLMLLSDPQRTCLQFDYKDNAGVIRTHKVQCGSAEANEAAFIKTALSTSDYLKATSLYNIPWQYSESLQIAYRSYVDPNAIINKGLRRVQCLSEDGKTCLSGPKLWAVNQSDMARLTSLSCGGQMYKLTGSTGFSSSESWCSKLRGGWNTDYSLNKYVRIIHTLFVEGAPLEIYYQCASLDGKNCLSLAQPLPADPALVQPIICSPEALNNPDSWCQTYRQRTPLPVLQKEWVW